MKYFVCFSHKLAPPEEYSRMASMTIWEQLLSNEFILFCLYFIIMMLWINTYFGTVERRIADYTMDQDKGTKRRLEC